MMKRSTKILLALLLLLGGATAAYFLAGRSSGAGMGGWDRKFKVEDPEAIHKIFLADRRGNQTTLIRTGDKWIYNGAHPANPNIMKNLLEAITRVELQYIPPPAPQNPWSKTWRPTASRSRCTGRATNCSKPTTWAARLPTSAVPS
ncbi:MAG: hypothetical protein IPJ00_02540 [Saprospirales bacterium]|nr:hypothetical protein [Saprospirales bacterium]